jgi:hypothetical protein
MATTQSNSDRGAPLMALLYKPPRSSIRRFFWRGQIWVESTFALSMLEGWEKILLGASPPLFVDVTRRD